MCVCVCVCVCACVCVVYECCVCLCECERASELYRGLHKSRKAYQACLVSEDGQSLEGSIHLQSLHNCAWNSVENPPAYATCMTMHILGTV